MTDINNLFFELIRVAIGTQETLSHPPSKGEWKQLYDMAKKQSLVGICFAAVQKLQCNDNQELRTQNPQPNSTQNQEPKTKNLDQVQYLTWMGMAAKIQQRNEVVNRQCVELQAKLSADGLKTSILKGQGVGQLYAEHLRRLRQSGDIDVWLDADAETTIKYVKNVAPTDDIERKHISLNVYSDTDVEVHWIPSELDNPFRNKRLKEWYEEQRESCFTNRIKLANTGEEICTPTVEFNLVYLLLHIYEHFLYEGIGLRQIMDWYFVLKNRNTDDHGNNDNLLYLLKQFGLMQFAKAVMCVMQKVFGMQKEQLFCEPDEVFGQKLLDEIMDGGNFGKYGKDGHQKDESKVKWVIRRLRRTIRLLHYDLIGALCRLIIRIRLSYWYKKMNNK